MPYHMLYTWQHGNWAPQFGDHDKEAVEYEQNDMVDSFKAGLLGWPRKYTKIITFARVPTQRQCLEKAATLAKPA